MCRAQTYLHRAQSYRQGTKITTILIYVLYFKKYNKLLELQSNPNNALASKLVFWAEDQQKAENMLIQFNTVNYL